MSFLTKSTSGKNVPVTKRTSDYDVFKGFDDFFNRRLDDFFSRRAGDEFYDWDLTAFSPVVNIEETKDAYHVEAEIPGVKKEDIEVNVKDDYLVIKGEKKSFNEEKKDQYHRVERSHGSFYRTIALPGDIDKDKISAELKDGVLQVDIKKSANKVESEKKIMIQ